MLVLYLHVILSIFLAGIVSVTIISFLLAFTWVLILRIFVTRPLK